MELGARSRLPPSPAPAPPIADHTSRVALPSFIIHLPRIIMNTDGILSLAADANNWSISEFNVNLFSSLTDTKAAHVNLVDWIIVPDETIHYNNKFANHSHKHSVSYSC